MKDDFTNYDEQIIHDNFTTTKIESKHENNQLGQKALNQKSTRSSKRKFNSQSPNLEHVLKNVVTTKKIVIAGASKNNR